MNINDARVLILSDGRTGGLNQSLGVAAMLGFKDPEVQTLRRRYSQRYLGWLPVGMLYENLAEFEKAAAKADLLIGAGRGPSRIMRHLKQLNPALFTVALMRPAGKLRDYDVVSIPKHDKPKPATNLIITLGNCNRITKDLMAQEADRWRKRLQHLRGVKLAVLVGGTSKHAAFTPNDARQLIASLTTVLKEQATNGAALMVSTSRRTGKAATAALEEALEKSGLPYYLWQPDDPTARDNPYFAYLALADAVLITADSTSMVSEAATAGKPIYLWGDETSVPKKFRHFYTALAQQGRLRWWPLPTAKPQAKQPPFQLNTRPPAAGLMDTLLVAGFIRATWQKRFKNS